MENMRNNYAFIDSQNLNLSIQSLGWKLDFAKFRVYLKEKHGVQKAFLFIGYVEGNSALYKSLQEAGFICIFKPTLKYKDGKTKGNCDAELVLHAMIEYPNYDQAILVSGDGDFHCLAEYLIKNKKLASFLVPNEKKYSALLKKLNTIDDKYLVFISPLRSRLEYKKGPYEDGTS